MPSISFAGDGLSPELLPAAELADCAATVLEQDAARILSYGTGAGYTPLRELVAEWLHVHPYRVLLTNGWLQGFNLLTSGRLQGARVLAEYPTYRPALQQLFAAGADVIYVNRHADGLDPEIVEYELRANQIALAYLMPTFQNPTGHSLSLDQRMQLATVFRRKPHVVVEDDTYGVLRYEGEQLPTLFDLSGQTTIWSTSFSFSVAPGLRVGAFALPADLAGALVETANSTYITPALLSQATVFEFARRGLFESNLERLRALLRERRDTMLAALEQHLPDATWSPPEGGIFLMVTLPPGIDTSAALRDTEGVTALGGSDFGGVPNALRLNYAACRLAEIEPGIERLAVALKAALV